MKVYNENMEMIENPNLTIGYLKSSSHTVHHEAVEGVEEKWHYETIREYPNGGRDVKKIVDVPEVEAREAWDEEIPILIFTLYTQEELDAIEAQKNKPTQVDRIEAQVLYTAMMTNTLLEEV